MKTNFFKSIAKTRLIASLLGEGLLLLTLLALAACQDEKEFLGGDITPGEVVTLSLSPVLPANAGIRPLSSGDGGATELNPDDYDLRYILEVYDGSTLVGTRQVEIAGDYETPVNFSVDLPAKSYTFVFWADFVTGGQTTDLTYKTDNAGGLTAIEWQASSYAIGNNLRDAYYAAEDIDLTVASANETVTLHRPLGKLRILATDVKGHLEANPGVNLGNAKLTYTDPTTFRKGFNALTGAPTAETISLTAATCTPEYVESVSVGEQTFNDVYLLAFDYFFVPGDLNKVSFKIELFDDGDASLASKTVANAPVGANKLTTVLGDMFNPGGSLDADIEDAFGVLEATFISGGPVPIPHWLNHEISLSSAILTWTNENVDSYEVVVNDGAPESVATNSIALDNLQEATAYNWKVRAVKDSKTSEWSYTKTFQTPAVPFIDKMVGSWGASDAVINVGLGEGGMGLDGLLGRDHTTSPVSVAMVKGSLLINAVTGMDDHIEGGVTSTTSFDIDSQLANLSLNIDENTKTVSADKSISNNNVYTKGNMKRTIGDIPNIREIITPDMLAEYSNMYETLMAGHITTVAITVTGVEITGTLNDNNQLTCQFKYSVSTKLTTDIAGGLLDNMLNGKLPTPQYLVSTVAMTK